MSEVKTTLLQIDLQNLFYEAQKRRCRLDLEKIFQYFQSREAELVTESIIYIVKNTSPKRTFGFDDFDSSKFENKLKSIGYTVKVKNAVRVELRGVSGESKSFFRQEDHNVLITVDCMERLPTFKKWILLSSDGSFADLCKSLRQKGKQVEVWSFFGTKSADLFVPYVDHLYYIKENFLYKHIDTSTFGLDGFPSEWVDSFGNRRYGPPLGGNGAVGLPARKDRPVREGGVKGL